jgi:hypothetical protein
MREGEEGRLPQLKNNARDREREGGEKKEEERAGQRKEGHTSSVK